MILSIYPKELKNYVHTNTCTRMLVAALLINTKSWMSTRCPLVGEWINYGASRQWNIITKENDLLDLPGDPVLKTLHFH